MHIFQSVYNGYYLQSETMAKFSPSTVKSNSRYILDVFCTPEKIGHLKEGLFEGS